jgi:hypothetical protein
MKKILLSNYTPADKSSSLSRQRTNVVYLGNGKTICFSNIKHLTKFFAETNRFINASVHELNIMYVSLFSDYRIVWFTEKSYRFEVEYLEKSFTKVVRWKDSDSANYFVFKDVFLIIDYLQVEANKLYLLQKKRNNYPETHKYLIMIRRLKELKNEFESYGHEKELLNPPAYNVFDGETYSEALRSGKISPKIYGKN